MDRAYELLQIATKYYSKKKLAHAVRVASYAFDCPLIEDEYRKSLWCVGLMHDILEDTNYTYSDLLNSRFLKDNEVEAIKLLTHEKDGSSYEEHLQLILDSKNQLAIIVKRADIKDHLMSEDPLTDKTKEKYFPTLKYLL